MAKGCQWTVQTLDPKSSEPYVDCPDPSYLERACAEGAAGVDFSLQLASRVVGRTCLAPRGWGPGRWRPEGQWHVRWRRWAEVLAEVSAQPAQGEREARPGRRAQHVSQDAQVKSEGGLSAEAPTHVRQAARGLWVLPGPLELQARGYRASGPAEEGVRGGEGGAPGKGAARGGPRALALVLPLPLTPFYPKSSHCRGEAVYDEHHLPRKEKEGARPVSPPPHPMSNRIPWPTGERGHIGFTPSPRGPAPFVEV